MPRRKVLGRWGWGRTRSLRRIRRRWLFRALMRNDEREPVTGAIRTLSREERIRRRRDFLRVQRRGTRTRGRYMTLIGLPGERVCSRLGIVAPRRLGNAVRRNLIKRVVREIFRHEKPVLATDLVVLPLPGFPDAPFSLLQDDYRRTLRRQLRARVRR